MQLELYTEHESITVTRAQALGIELKLNVLPEGKLWRELGDKLYEFHTQQTPTRWYVTPTQLNLVKSIVTNP